MLLFDQVLNYHYYSPFAYINYTYCNYMHRKRVEFFYFYFALFPLYLSRSISFSLHPPGLLIHTAGFTLSRLLHFLMVPSDEYQQTVVDADSNNASATSYALVHSFVLSQRLLGIITITSFIWARFFRAVIAVNVATTRRAVAAYSSSITHEFTTFFLSCWVHILLVLSAKGTGQRGSKDCDSRCCRRRRPLRFTSLPFNKDTVNWIAALLHSIYGWLTSIYCGIVVVFLFLPWKPEEGKSLMSPLLPTTMPLADLPGIMATTTTAAAAMTMTTAVSSNLFCCSVMNCITTCICITYRAVRKGRTKKKRRWGP